MTTSISLGMPFLTLPPTASAVPDLENESFEINNAVEDLRKRTKRLEASSEYLTVVAGKQSRHIASNDATALAIKVIESEVHDAISQVRSSERALVEKVEGLEGQRTLTPTEQDLFDQVKAMLGNLDSHYLAYYQEAITKFTEYFDQIREALNKIYVNATNGDSTTHVHMNTDAAHAALKDILEKTWSVATFKTEDEARKFGDTLAPGFKVVKNGDTWEVRIDTAQASMLKEHLPTRPGVGEDINIPTVQFNSWVNTRDSAVASLNTAAQVTAEAFSRGNSTRDNAVKLLSSLIESMIKMMEGFLPA